MKREIDQCPVTRGNLSEMLSMVKAEPSAERSPKDVFEEMYQTGERPDKIVKEKAIWVQIA